MADNEEKPTKAAASGKPKKRNQWGFLTQFFNGLQWLTERIIGLLRALVTAAMFLVVAFVIYNAWESRNTVAVKPFQVPVAMGKQNHEQAGRIIANLLNRHLLDAQNTLQSQLNRDGVNLNNPVSVEQQVLIEGESIKLPETGITIDNVIEFISGIFGRKNLNGSVYFESDLQDALKTKLHLQITLRGRIISFSEDDLGEQQRGLLPETRKDSLNIQLISAMLRARSKEILSIASEDYNLYYFCTRETTAVEHDDSRHHQFFGYCRELQSADVTPGSLQSLKTKVDKHGGAYSKSIVGSVLAYLKEESHKRQATLCQSKVNQSDAACSGINVADARRLAKGRATESVAVANAPVLAPNSTFFNMSGASVAHSVNSVNSLSVEPVGSAISLYSMRAVADRCAYLRNKVEGAQTDIVPKLEQQCFPTNPVQQSPVQQAIAQIASPEAKLEANQAEGDAKQLLHNGLYAESLVKYQEAISLNCNNAVAWANIGILLSTASAESKVQDYVQAQCALLRATTMNESAGWIRHSLCVAQAKDAKGDLERFLSYESCQRARQLEPINEALYDKLFYIDIGHRYRELEEYEAAYDAYAQAMSTETVRSHKTRETIVSLLALEEKGIEKARSTACTIYKQTVPAPVKEGEAEPTYEVELKALMSEQGCV